ncbi:MAG: hypothetical protein C3F15_06790 [Holophagae bacterium]|nr:MAG: hypothetical protein C3F15_06790 [Holophagae bacterium]
MTPSTNSVWRTRQPLPRCVAGTRARRSGLRSAMRDRVFGAVIAVQPGRRAELDGAREALTRYKEVRMRRAVFAIAVAVLVSCLDPVWAGTTGQINVTIVDSGGQPLPGVQVTVESPALIGGPQIQVTSEAGNVQFTALPPGEYKFSAVLHGFVTQELTGVKVVLDEITRLQAAMAAASFADQVVVTAEAPVVNVTKTAVGQAYSEDVLQATALGSSNRQFTSAIAKTPGTLQSGYYGDVQVFGSANNENAYYIDGLSNNEPVTNNFNSRLNFDAIDEISVQTAAYNAEFGFAIGGVFNLITKSGGNQFSGSVDGRYVGSDFTATGDHFDPSSNLYTYRNVAATLGGPLMLDKLWFFASIEDFTQEQRPADVVQTNQNDRLTGFGKLTWQVADSWRMVAKYNYDDWTNENARAIPLVQPEADATDDRTFQTAQVEAFGTLSESLVLNLQAGTTDNEVAVAPASGDLETIGHMDLATGIFSVNYMDAQFGTEGRDQLLGDLSWFLDDLGGAHEIKAGIDVSRVTFRNERFMPGGFNYLDLAGGPYVLQQLEPATGSYKGDYRSAFLQDSWRPVANLTVNLGLRYDKTTYDVTTTGVRVASMDQVQPRFGVAWDVSGNAKTAVRGFYGEFMHPGAMTIPLLSMSASAATYLECSVLGFPDAATCAQVAPQYGMPYLDDPGDYPGTGWALVAPGGSGGLVIDPNIKGPKAKQWTLGVEHEIFRNSSLGLQYIEKHTNRFFESTCNGNVPTPSEGAPCDYLVITNDVPAKRDYTGWVLSFNSRASDKLTLLASYTYSKSEGSLELTQGASVDFDVYPIHFDNRYGYLSNDRRHQLKVNGMWLLPYQFSLGFGFNWNSPFRWTPEDPVVTQGYGTYFIEPRGSREGEDFYQLDLQFAKRFTLGNTLDLEVILSLINATNAENATAVCTSTYGCLGTQATGDPSRWQLPRRAELGMRFTF